MPRLDLGPNEEYELCPGYTLRRATADEVDKIRDFVGDSRCLGHSIRAYYEGKPVKDGENTLLMEQPREYWKYCVVHFVGAGENLTVLEYALDFLYFAPVLVITLFDQGGSKWNLRYLGHGVQQNLFGLNRVDPPDEKFPAKCLPIIRSIYDKLKGLPDDDPAVIPFHRFHLLKHLPEDSGAHSLGLFSVIEMILTHKPADNLHDSLRHQVSSKMVLLGKRFVRNELYQFYAACNPLDLWKALYDWRSHIAHGEHIDFNKGSLKKLENDAKARTFLDLSVRLLLKATVDEPELIADLKRC